MPRTTSQHLSAAEIETLKNCFLAGLRSGLAAKQVDCSSRIAQKYYALFRAEGLTPAATTRNTTLGDIRREHPTHYFKIKNKPKVQLPDRHYKGSFEL